MQHQTVRQVQFYWPSDACDQRFSQRSFLAVSRLDLCRSQYDLEYLQGSCRWQADWSASRRQYTAGSVIMVILTTIWVRDDDDFDDDDGEDDDDDEHDGASGGSPSKGGAIVL